MASYNAHAMFSQLRRLATTNLWSYSDDTPDERLYRHYRIAKPIVYTWLTACVTMLSTLFEFLFSREGFWREATMIIVFVALGVAFLSALPALLCSFWAEEIEKTLAQRGCPPAGKEPMGIQVGKAAMKMCFWVAVLMLGVHLFK
jgi:hypothetical protein